MDNEKWLFPKNIEEAKSAQKEMSQSVLLQDVITTSLTCIAGMDVSNTPFDPEETIFAAVVLLSYPSLKVIETKTQIEKQEFPYIPGLLGFREAPSLIHAYKQLALRPDLIMVDGQGISHPRGLGIASQLGVLLDIPTIGIAKSVLVGRPEKALGEEEGSMVPLLWKGTQIGAMIRTKKRCSPLIISPGHKITLKTAVEIVSNCLRKYRLPEPTRQAHLAANVCRKKFIEFEGCVNRINEIK